MNFRGYLMQGFIIFLSLVLGLNLVRSWIQLSRRGDILAREEAYLEKERLQREQLKRRLAQAQTQSYREYIAREKLNIRKEGEVVVLLPSLAPIMLETPTPTPMPPTWIQWKAVFF